MRQAARNSTVRSVEERRRIQWHLHDLLRVSFELRFLPLNVFPSWFRALRGEAVRLPLRFRALRGEAVRLPSRFRVLRGEAVRLPSRFWLLRGEAALQVLMRHQIDHLRRAALEEARHVRLDDLTVGTRPLTPHPSPSFFVPRSSTSTLDPRVNPVHYLLPLDIFGSPHYDNR